MTDEQFEEIRSFVRNHPAAQALGGGEAFSGIVIEVDYDAEAPFVRIVWEPPRLELSGGEFSDLRRRLGKVFP